MVCRLGLLLQDTRRQTSKCASITTSSTKFAHHSVDSNTTMDQLGSQQRLNLKTLLFVMIYFRKRMQRKAID